MRIAPIAVLAAALCLSACNKKPHEEPVIDNAALNDAEEMPVDTVPNALEAPKNVTAPRAPEQGFSDEAQMLDDADATGLTSRLPSEKTDTPGANGNETRPVEQ